MRETLLFCRHRILWVVRRPSSFVVPILFLLAIVLAGKLFSPQFRTLRNVKAIVIDNDQTEESRLLWERLSAAEVLRVENTIEDMDIDAAKTKLLKHQVSAVFVIEDGFAKNLAERGMKNKLIRAYYNDYSIAAKVVSETVAAEAMRIFVTEKGLRFVEAEAVARGYAFTEADMRANRDWVESYWARGLTFQPEVEWLNPDDVQVNGATMSVVADVLVGFLAAMCIAVQLAFLAEEKERRILSGIEALGRSALRYMLCTSLVTVAVLLVPLCILQSERWMAFAAFGLWAMLAVNGVIVLCRKRSMVMQLLPVLFVALAFLAAMCLYFSGSMPWLQAVGILNPFYCLLLPDTGLAALVLAVHSIVLLVGMWVAKKQRIIMVA